MDDIGELIAQLEELRHSFDAQRERLHAIAGSISITEGELDRLLDDIQRLRAELAGTGRTLDQLEARQRDIEPRRHP